MPGHPDADDEGRDLSPWGIEPGYHDIAGAWHPVEDGTARALREAMGADGDLGDAGAPPPGTTTIVRPGAPIPVRGPGTLELEDGTHLAATHELPPDLPLGYHRWHAAGGSEHLIIAPGHGPLTAGMRAWGITAQLYAARSRSSWGIGDLADLGIIADWARRHGAAAIGLNPLHAPTPSSRPANSPYTPSSRRWRDPISLAIEQVPGAGALPDLAERAARARRLDDAGHIDRAAVWAAKRSALEAIWTEVGPGPGFDAYRAEHGEALDRWALFCTLADRHGPDWRTWPAELRRPTSAACRRVADEARSTLAFWAWLQWLVDEQLAASSAGELIVADLAVGIDAGGADAWEWQDLLALDVHIGAPPDLLGPDGQDWGLPPFVPWRLRAAGYEPFAATIRACLRGARGLRIDHVMGLFRLFWIPPGRTAAHGAYVRGHGRDLLDIVCLEATRAGALIVGEDLGTVGTGVRDELAAAGVLSTRLLWFEDDPPERWPTSAMAAITTHDLPTVAGVWSGVDRADLRAAGVGEVGADEGDALFRHRLRVAAGADDDADTETIVLAAHRALAAAPSVLVTAALDDLVGAEHRPNVPGTIDEHPNWRIPLPVPVDDLDLVPRAEAIAAILARR